MNQAVTKTIDKATFVEGCTSGRLNRIGFVVNPGQICGFGD